MPVRHQIAESNHPKLPRRGRRCLSRNSARRRMANGRREPNGARRCTGPEIRWKSPRDLAGRRARPRGNRCPVDCVTISRTILRFLLLLAALAFAGAAGESRTGSELEMITAAGPAVGVSAFEPSNGPKPPTFFRVARPPGLAVVGRVLEHGPPTGGLCPSCIRFADLPPLPPSLDPTRQRALARSRLEFAHDSAFARSGALSSFSTSLPPPLLA